MALLLSGCAHRPVRITPLPARRMAQIAPSPKTHIIAWQSQPQTVYGVEISTNMFEWSMTGMEQAGTGGMEWITVAGDASMGFYRVGSRTIPIVVPYEIPLDPNREITMKHRGQ